MRAEVISIGDELTSGQRLDTNSQWLSERLGGLGVRVMFHTTVADDLESNIAAFRVAGERVDFVVSTGGLGPTADDLTRESIAAAAGVELELRQAALDHIRALFARRQREMPQRNEIQAMFPAGSRVIHNPHGSAPGIDFDLKTTGGSSCRIFALPGVPAEMREMWRLGVEPEILGMLGDDRRIIRHYRIKCFGVGESDLEQMLPDLIRRGRRPSVGITVHQATITLRITADGRADEECQGLIAETAATIRDCLGSLVFGEEDDELQDAVVRQLKAGNQTVAVAEIGPGGLIGNWLSEADPAATVYRGGFVIRDESAVQQALGDEESAVTDQTATDTVVSMARRCRNAFSADYCIAVGPFPESAHQPDEPGQVVLAVAHRDGVQTRSSTFAGHPDILKARCAKQALDLLRCLLLESGNSKSLSDEGQAR